MLYLQGDKGDKGDTGAKGLKGHTGHKGDQVRQISFYQCYFQPSAMTRLFRCAEVHHVFPCVCSGAHGTSGTKRESGKSCYNLFVCFKWICE